MLGLLRERAVHTPQTSQPQHRLRELGKQVVSMVLLWEGETSAWGKREEQRTSKGTMMGMRALPRETVSSFFLFKDFIYSFMRDTQREAETGRGRSRLLAGSPMQDLIPGPGIIP